MSQLPVVDSREYLPYLLLDCNLRIQKFSELLKQYSEEFQDLAIGNDVRLAFPELVGLEAVCEEILQQKQDKFVLESVAREQDEDNILYFDISIQSIKNQLILFIEDVTELVNLRQSFVQKANEAELNLSTLKRFEYCTNKIINSMEDILFITTASGIIERTNRAAAKLLGYRKLELIDRPLNDFFNQPDFNHLKLYQYLISNQKNVERLETCFVNQEQKIIEIEFDCFVIPTEVPDIYSCVYIGRDITLRKKAERDMMQALEKEKELRQLKSRFLSMASHEFRNPLSSILVCIDMLSQNKTVLPAEDRDFYLQLIKDSALNIQSILEDVLVLSKAESNTQTFNPNYLDLIEFCQQIIKEIQLSYAERNIDLITSQDEIEFYGDAKLLWHIFTNLLSNALKYSPETTKVELEIIEGESIVSISVRDRGIGIPQEAQKHLFESFYRGNNVGEIPGTGLGLAIVKKAIDLHGGTINVISDCDRGTTMQLQLPHKNLT